MRNISVGELAKIIERDGWYLARQSGSHRQYKHPFKIGLVTLAFHKASKDVPPGTLKSVLKQAQISEDAL